MTTWAIRLGNLVNSIFQIQAGAEPGGRQEAETPAHQPLPLLHGEAVDPAHMLPDPAHHAADQAHHAPLIEHDHPAIEDHHGEHDTHDDHDFYDDHHG